MPSKYGKDYAVPPEFPSLLKAFTREVLRAQPGDVYQFGAEYFTELLAQAEAAQMAEAGGVKRLSPAELQELLTDMFMQADTDGSGALSMSEFKNVLKMGDLGLNDREVKRVMAEADVNGDGEVTYDEFIPLAVDLVMNMYAKMETAEAKAAEEEEARDEAKNFLLHGMDKAAVEATMNDIFHKADADGSGALSIAEFQQCCKEADIGLTRKEINMLMHQCDVDGDGMITYDEFVPLCFEMLVEILKDQILFDKKSPSELEQYLLAVCYETDTLGTGMLDPLALKEVLRSADLGLSRLQIHSVLNEGEYDEDGMCNYAKFLPTVADLIYRMLDMDQQIERAENIAALQNGGTDFTVVHGYSEGDVGAILMAEFQSSDSSGSGVLSKADLVAALKSSSLGLSAQEVSSLVAAAEPTDGGLFFYQSLAGYAFYILQYLAMEGAL